MLFRDRLLVEICYRGMSTRLPGENLYGTFCHAKLHVRTLYILAGACVRLSLDVCAELILSLLLGRARMYVAANPPTWEPSLDGGIRKMADFRIALFPDSSIVQTSVGAY